MLVLSRKIGEQIVINDNIRVTVVGLKGNVVRLGIDAPPEVPIDRAEIHERRLKLVDVEVPGDLVLA